MKVSPERTANRPSCVDQERTSLSKRNVFIVTQLNRLDVLSIIDYLYLYRYLYPNVAYLARYITTIQLFQF